MAIQLKVPLTKTFYFKCVEENNRPSLRRTVEGEAPDCYVKFRQATTADIESRTGAMSTRTWKSDGEQFVLVDDTNMDYVARQEVFLTLCETDIQFPDGSELEFERGRIKSRKKFDEWWNIMPLQYGLAIHLACLEANPDFPKRFPDAGDPGDA